jgi:hypothetical protein
VQSARWSQRYTLANNRNRLLLEDARQYRSESHRLRTALKVNTIQYADAEGENELVQHAYASLTQAHGELELNQIAYDARAANIQESCDHTRELSHQLNWKLINLGGRIGSLTSAALNKIKERIAVVEQVESIKLELQQVVDVELAESIIVAALMMERTALTSSIDSMTIMHTSLLAQVEALESQIALIGRNQKMKEEAMSEEEKKIAELQNKLKTRTTTKEKAESTCEGEGEEGQRPMCGGSRCA